VALISMPPETQLLYPSAPSTLKRRVSVLSSSQLYITFFEGPLKQLKKRYRSKLCIFN
jgi:hypothetical protein